ncbi:MAG TPA: DUF6438 domain-containing protein [Saprospiraceae bacterium]|nr:DUF6438 domain-containing protein [Saprospiraceae bacterium]
MIVNNITIPIIIFVFLQSCGANKITNQSLLGEWISTENSKLYFSFEKDRCYYLSAWGNFSPYTLNDSVIIITDTIKGQHSKEFRESKFRILKLKDNELELFTEYAPLYTSLDTIKLQRIKPNSIMDFKNIEFESSGCFGSCPSMKLKINQNFEIFYEGRNYTEKNGYYSGKITSSQMERLKRKLSLVELKTLKENYLATWTDDQTCDISIQTKDTVYTSSVYGFDKEPIELRILFHELMELYKHIDMRKDSSHNYYDEFSHE